MAEKRQAMARVEVFLKGGELVFDFGDFAIVIDLFCGNKNNTLIFLETGYSSTYMGRICADVHDAMTEVKKISAKDFMTIKHYCHQWVRYGHENSLKDLFRLLRINFSDVCQF